MEVLLELHQQLSHFETTQTHGAVKMRLILHVINHEADLENNNNY